MERRQGNFDHLSVQVVVTHFIAEYLKLRNSLWQDCCPHWITLVCSTVVTHVRSGLPTGMPGVILEHASTAKGRETPQVFKRSAVHRKVIPT
jgi:hypothetical protein